MEDGFKVHFMSERRIRIVEPDPGPDLEQMMKNSEMEAELMLLEARHKASVEKSESGFNSSLALGFLFGSLFNL